MHGNDRLRQRGDFGQRRRDPLSLNQRGGEIAVGACREPRGKARRQACGQAYTFDHAVASRRDLLVQTRRRSRPQKDATARMQRVEVICTRPINFRKGIELCRRVVDCYTRRKAET